MTSPKQRKKRALARKLQQKEQTSEVEDEFLKMIAEDAKFGDVEALPPEVTSAETKTKDKEPDETAKEQDTSPPLPVGKDFDTFLEEEGFLKEAEEEVQEEKEKEKASPKPKRGRKSTKKED